MIWTNDNNETSRFESERRTESLSIPLQELAFGLIRIRAARANVEVSIDDVISRLAQKSFNADVERAREAADAQAASQAQVVSQAHEYPLVSNAAATAPSPAVLLAQAPAQPETDILHEDQLDADAIRARLDGLIQARDEAR